MTPSDVQSLYAGIGWYVSDMIWNRRQDTAHDMISLTHFTVLYTDRRNDVVWITDTTKGRNVPIIWRNLESDY